MEMARRVKSREAFIGILKRLPGNSAFRQRERILSAMGEFGSVTTLEATRFLDVVDPRPRIFELRAEGHQIVTTSVTQASESGGYHRVGEYILARRLPRVENDPRLQGARFQHWVQLTLPLAR